MSANQSLKTPDHVTDHKLETYRMVRYFAALVTALTAIMYFMIGFNVVTVVDPGIGQAFGIYAGAAYVVGAVLLVSYERRLLWVLGAILQVFVIYTYFSLAPERTPAYEFWGILIRIAQVVILIALGYLAMQSPPDEEADLS